MTPAGRLAGLALVSALTGCATTTSFPTEPYFASGSEPFWSLEIENGRLRFDSMIDPIIDIETPRIRRTANGYWISFSGVRIDIIRRECEEEDARVYPHTVRAIGPGYTLRGCGGLPPQEPDN